MTTVDSLGRLTVLVVAAALLATSCDDGGSDAGEAKAGGAEPPVVLRIGTPEGTGAASTDALDEFVRIVESDVGASVQVEPVYLAAGGWNVDDWDQVVARRVMSGELDMAIIPARAWDTEGVDSMRALHAPLLVDSDELVDHIVTSDLADQMLAGLEPIGVTGLAMLPEGLRRVFSFTSPILGPEDYQDVAIRTSNSATIYALFESLGADPDDYPGATIDEALVAGELSAAESSFGLARFKADTVLATGNVVLFPKVNTLVINSDRFAELAPEQQQAIQDAADHTREFARGAIQPDALQAAAFCDRQAGSIVLASDEDVAGLEIATSVVYDELERDADTKRIIADLRAMKAATRPGFEAVACGAAPATDTDATDESASVAVPFEIDGIYRYEVTEEMFIERGVKPDQLGVHTLTIDAGRWHDEWDQGDVCEGTYTVDGDRYTVKWVTGCSGDWAMTLVSADPLMWGEIETLPPFANDPLAIAYNEIFNSVPVTRIGDVD